MWDLFDFAAATPESMGIDSANIAALLDDLARYGAEMHSVLILRRGKVVAEYYYKPFTADRKHRMYSCSKSFVSTAIGLLCDEGKLHLTDKVCSFFPDYCDEPLHPYVAEATIRDLLLMASPYNTTTYSWDREDWVSSFFHTKPARPAGTAFCYDTSATYILDVLVERLTGMTFLEYLYDRVLQYTGFSPDATCVKAPDGYSWGGSGVLATTRDLARLAMLYLAEGKVKGVQRLSQAYVREATASQIPSLTNTAGHYTYSSHGYGYQIWKTPNGGFSFNGMGCQFAFAEPSKDLLFVCTADAQGHAWAGDLLYDSFWRNIYNTVSDAPLPENPVAYENLQKKGNALSLFVLPGAPYADIENEIGGKTYILNENPMQISDFRLEFGAETGTFYYTTPRGAKEITFGRCAYAPGVFPETHYSGEQIGKPKGAGYRCLASGCWSDARTLTLRVLITDDYFGNMTATFGFKGKQVGLIMSKTAENFLNEYAGQAGGEQR